LDISDKCQHRNEVARCTQSQSLLLTRLHADVRRLVWETVIREELDGCGIHLDIKQGRIIGWPCALGSREEECDAEGTKPAYFGAHRNCNAARGKTTVDDRANPTGRRLTLLRLPLTCHLLYAWSFLLPCHFGGQLFCTYKPGVGCVRPL
jgi:hypothetical protein